MWTNSPLQQQILWLWHSYGYSSLLIADGARKFFCRIWSDPYLAHYVPGNNNEYLREDPLQGSCHCPHLQRDKEGPWAALHKVTQQHEGLRMRRLVWWDLHKKYSFGGGRAFPEPNIPLEPASPWGSCVVRALGSKMPGMVPVRQILLPPVLCHSPHLPQPRAKQTWFLAGLKEARGKPHRFCRNRASGEMFKSHWFIGPSSL